MYVCVCVLAVRLCPRTLNICYIPYMVGKASFYVVHTFVRKYYTLLEQYIRHA